MLTMLRFFNASNLGIEITARALKLGVLAGSGASVSLLASKAVQMPSGMVSEGYATLNIRDREGLDALIRSCLQEFSPLAPRRAGLSLPDGIFRIQTLEFDELPSGNRDRDRLVRWRLEKGASFDTAGTVLRYQVLPRRDRGYTVLASVAKQDVLSQYEELLSGRGLEPWSVGPSSFNALNYYSARIAANDLSGAALVWITDGSYATIIMERGGPRFYRYREYKAGSPEDVAGRLLRELDDSLHFYTHMDRMQPSEIGHIYLAGDPSVMGPLAESLRNATTLGVETLEPGMVIPSADASPAMAAVLGAGGALC